MCVCICMGYLVSVGLGHLLRLRRECLGYRWTKEGKAIYLEVNDATTKRDQGHFLTHTNRKDNHANRTNTQTSQYCLYVPPVMLE